MTDQPKPRPPHTGCPTCGHTTNHNGHAIAERECAAAWLTSTTGLPHDEAARVIRKLSTTVDTRNSVRVLDTLIDLGWRPGGEG